ncbi:hypothetical protein O0L34_g18242 [Tuta absoluta]|nr:hypothetical protein O0L34_g18242 [Tuta absoluta]
MYVLPIFLLLGVSYANKCDLAKVCVTDLTCPAGQTLVPNTAVDGCCPSCQQPSTGGVVVQQEGCQAPSNCLSNGKYAPVQCKGDMFVGRCFCVDEDGNRIFGQMWRSEASQMTCACSRRRSELEKEGRNDVTLHCTTHGDYEVLQCDDGLCWCAEPKTGQPTVIPLPEEDMKYLPCYSARVMGAQYLRKCESVVHALSKIHKEQSEHGTHFLGNPITFCDYDGSFGPYQIQNGIAYCTGRDAKILGSWQASSSELGSMNCNCARDSTIFFPERGMEVTAICTGNGNYRPNQNSGDVFYCVDRDGYQVGNLSDAWPADNCASLTNRTVYFSTLLY